MKTESIKELIQVLRYSLNGDSALIQFFIRLQYTTAYEEDPEFKEFVRDLITAHDEIRCEEPLV